MVDDSLQTPMYDFVISCYNFTKDHIKAVRSENLSGDADYALVYIATKKVLCGVFYLVREKLNQTRRRSERFKKQIEASIEVRIR